MKIKHLLIAYSLFFVVTPKPPSVYTFIVDTAGTINSMVAHGIIIAYLHSRPPMQKTVIQPFSMLIIIAMVGYNVKEYTISLIGNCFHTALQSLVDSNLLLACGFFNNRLVFSAIIYSVAVLSSSKLLLLVRPTVYHGANHDRIVRICLFMFGVYFLLDTFLYLVFGNIYYCHDFSTLRLGHIYDLKLDVELLKSQHIMLLHTILDKIYLSVMAICEILIVYVSWKKNPAGRVDISARCRRIFSISGNIARVVPASVPMYAINMSEEPHSYKSEEISIPAACPQFPDLNTQIHQLKAAIMNMPDQVPNSAISNKIYLINCIFIFGSILYVQISLNSINTALTDATDVQGPYVAVMCYVAYCRFFKFALPVIWVFHNPHFRHYLLLKVKQLIIKYNIA